MKTEFETNILDIRSTGYIEPKDPSYMLLCCCIPDENNNKEVFQRYIKATHIAYIVIFNMASLYSRETL